MTKRFLFFSLLVLGSMLNKDLRAQQPADKLSGRVLDAQNGSPLVGASVLVEGSAAGARTDVEGRFFIPVENNHRFNITISSIGYQTKQINDIQAAGKEGISVSLDRTTAQLENIVIIASVKKETLSSLYQLQRSSSAISDGISAEVIKKSPDKNTGEVLKRVGGTSVQDNKFVVIRGMSERYNISMLNNSVLPSTEADKKAFAFDIIPSSLVDNVIIYKSPTPDLPGDFSGGAVKIVTRDYPSHPLSELSVSLGYNSLTTGKNFYKSYPDGSLDAVGFFDNSRLIPGPYARNEKGFILKSPEFKRAVTKTFPNTFGYDAANRSMPNLSVSYTGGNTKLYPTGNKLGYIYSVGYSNGRSVSERRRTEYPIDKSLIYDYNTINYDEKNNLSALLNLSYAYKNSKISFKNLFNNDFRKTTGIRNGLNVTNSFDPFYIRSTNNEAQNNGILNSVLEGLHRIGRNWTVDWSGSFGYTYRNQPDQRILTFRSDGDADESYYLRLSNENSPEIRNAGRVYAFLGEYIYGVNANATRQFTLFNQTQKFRFGTMNYYRDRSVEVTALGYASLDPYGVKIPVTVKTGFNNIFSPANIDEYNLSVANIETNSTSYSANALLNAGYLMLDNKLSDKIKLTWGVRMEKYHQQLASAGKKNIEKDNTDVLPSFLLTYALNPKTNIRVAGSRAVNRPEFRELADYSVFDYDNYFVIRGNPDLKRAKNSNADLRYEWFPGVGEIISASIFYKHFTDPIEQTNLGNDVLSYENADQATVYGAEFELRKKLDFIESGFFSRLSFYANAAYIKGAVKFGNKDSNNPMQGQSPYLLNGGLSYANTDNDFSVNVLYNRIGPRLRFRAVSEGALNVFEKSRDVLDFQVGKKLIGNKLEIKLTVSDLLAQRSAWYYKFGNDPSNIKYNPSADKIIISVRSGTTGTLSLKYSF